MTATTLFQSFSLAGRKGLILGLANEQSIAYGCARALRALGAEFFISCLNDKAAAVVRPLAQQLEAELQVCNVEHEDELEGLVQHAAEKLGQFDFVLHSIAWAPLEDLHGRVIDSSSSGFSRAIEVSCHSFATLARLCAPHMPQGGSMVTMTYLGADEVVPHYGLMGPVKAALESLVRYMAVELGPKNIRVHAISPSPIATRAASGIKAFDELMQETLSRAPLKRLVSIDEVGQLCAFLCSPAATGMTGQTIYIDAGYHCVA